MIFSSAIFLFFFTAVFLIHWYVIGAIKNEKTGLKLSHSFLLGASYLFYMSWDWRFGGLMLFSTLVDYYCGYLLDTRQNSRKLILAASVITNLAVLGYFKYTDFFLASLVDFIEILGFDVSAGTKESLLLNLILPLGISFFTFQSMSYTIDVYRRVIPAEKSFLRFALFVSFFPQLVAGPIVMAKTFLPQLNRRPDFSIERMKIGARWFALGYFKKVVLADNMAPIVDAIYSSPASYDLAGHWLGAFAFWVQVYGDFSGYSDMAWGTAIWLGYSLPENFRMPYLSTSVTEHWQRWHISLIAWIRDYLYIPLGGNRVSFFRHKINIFLTMFLAGLWHGANWTYVVWGSIHGIILAGEATFKQIRESSFARKSMALAATDRLPATASSQEKRSPPPSLLPAKIGAPLAFLATTFCTVFFGTMFRSRAISDSWLILLRMLGLDVPEKSLPVIGEMYRPVIWSVIALYIGHWLGKLIFDKKRLNLIIPGWIEFLFYIFFIILTWEIGARDANAFIYFVF